MSASVQAGNGMGFFGMLTILFIGLKLTNYINWPWKFVLAPILIPACIFTGIIILIGILKLIIVLLDSKSKRRW